jgi:hypothetical protein
MVQRTVAPLDQESARTALDELFTLARKYNSSEAYVMKSVWLLEQMGRARLGLR